MSKRGIRYISYLQEPGYGHAARGYLRGLLHAGVAVTWTPLVRSGVWKKERVWQPLQGDKTGDAELDALCHLPLEYDVVIAHTLPSDFAEWRGPERGKRWLGYTTWETDRLPSGWREPLNAMDALLVPTEFNRQAFRTSGVTRPIHVVPHLLSPAPSTSSGQAPSEPLPLPGVRATDFVFYTIGEWNARKAIWNVLRCYWETFTAHESVLLVVKTSRQDWTRFRYGRYWRIVGSYLDSTRRAVNALRREYPNPARVVLLDRELTDGQIASLHQRGDCFVSLSHGEGWGLGAFEAASAGNPVIITGYGGPWEFLPLSYPYLVRYTMQVPDAGHALFTPDQHWAEPDIEHADQLLRQVFEHRADARMYANHAQKFVNEKFNETIVTRQLLQAIESVRQI